MPTRTSPLGGARLFAAASLVALLGAAGCASSPSHAGAGASTTGTTSATGGAGATGTGGTVGTGGGSPDAGLVPMKLISRGAPASASGTAAGVSPGAADDANPASAWVPDALPAWLAYDLSGVPSSDRQRALVTWYDFLALDYANASPGANLDLPADYTLEINTAPGGGSAPATGWTTVATVTGNTHSAGQHLIDLKGASWVRMSVTKSSNPTAVTVDLDVYSAPTGPDDDWLFMGDSITFISTPRAFSDLPALVTAAHPERVPAVICGAEGGTNTVTANGILVDTLATFPGRFVVLAYGTNDHASDYEMEGLVQKVLAAGKIPVVPHMPWSDTAQIQMEGPMINAAIDALYAKYPQIVPGPDLWQVFLGRTDLIPSGDIHPDQQGQEVLRGAWAKVMGDVFP